MTRWLYGILISLAGINLLAEPATMYEEAKAFLADNASGHSVHIAHEYIRNLLVEKNTAYNLLTVDAGDQYENYLIGAQKAKICVILPLRADPALLALFEQLLQLREESDDPQFAIVLQATFEQDTTFALLQETIQRLPQGTPLILIDESIGTDPLILQSGRPLMSPRYLFTTIRDANTDDIPIIYQGSRLLEAINRELFRDESITSALLSQDIPAVVFAGDQNDRLGTHQSALNRANDQKEEGVQQNIDSLARLIANTSQGMTLEKEIRRVDWQTQFLTLQYGLGNPIFLTEIQLYLISLSILGFFLFLLVFARKGFDRYIVLLIRHWRQFLVFTGLLILAVGVGYGVVALLFAFKPDSDYLSALIVKISLSLGMIYLIYPISVRIFQIHRANRFLTIFALFWVMVNMVLLPVVSLSFILHSTLIFVCCYVFSVSRRVAFKVLFLLIASILILVDVVLVRYIHVEALIDTFLNDVFLGNLVFAVLIFPYFCMLARCELLLCRKRLYVSYGCSFVFLVTAIVFIGIMAFRPVTTSIDLVERIDIQKKERMVAISRPETVSPYVLHYGDRVFYAKGAKYEEFLLPYTDADVSISIAENHTVPVFRFQVAYTTLQAPSRVEITTYSPNRIVPQTTTWFSDQPIGAETREFVVAKQFAPPSADAVIVVSGQTQPELRVALQFPNDGMAFSDVKNLNVHAITEYVYDTATE